MQNMIRLPTLNQKLHSHYNGLEIADISGSINVVDEETDMFYIENTYSIPDFMVMERITVDRRSGKPTDVCKDFEYSKRRISPAARKRVKESAEKISDNTNGVFYMSKVKGANVLRFEAHLCPKGEIDDAVVKGFREIEALTYLSTNLHRY